MMRNYARDSEIIDLEYGSNSVLYNVAKGISPMPLPHNLKYSAQVMIGKACVGSIQDLMTFGPVGTMALNAGLAAMYGSVHALHSLALTVQEKLARSGVYSARKETHPARKIGAAIALAVPIACGGGAIISIGAVADYMNRPQPISNDVRSQANCVFNEKAALSPVRVAEIPVAPPVCLPGHTLDQ